MDNGNYTGRIYAYFAVGLTAASIISFGLSFTALGIYALIASVILSISAVTFANIQKRRNNFRQLLIIRIIAYAALCVTTLFFIGGLLWSIE